MTYNEFIQNILDTRGRFNCGEEYHETHHILPRCLGGTNDKDNLIDLFAREHFIAHKLLTLENPHNEKLAYAWWQMCHCTNDEAEYEVTPYEYEDARQRVSAFLSESRKGENNPFYGRSHSKESREKMSFKGENNPMYGVHRFGEDNPMYGVHRYGKENPMYGKHQSDESRKKISQSRIGKYCGSNCYNAKKIIRLSDLKIYGCGADAAKDNAVCRDTIYQRCRKHKDFMYYDEWLTEQNNLEK